ncbi:hypothetical protein NUITMVA2_21730 [Aeromonas caviae]|nr:hypothetical protein NUITMVA2_21730 [Aeromonas caviae]
MLGQDLTDEALLAGAELDPGRVVKAEIVHLARLSVWVHAGRLVDELNYKWATNIELDGKWMNQLQLNDVNRRERP